MTRSPSRKTDTKQVGIASPGDVIAFPLSTGGWGVGLVTRGYQFGKLNMLYSFGMDIAFDTRPSADAIALVKRTRILTWCNHSDPLIRNGEWMILGNMPNFSLEEWIWPPSAPMGSPDSWQLHSDVLNVLDEATLLPVQVPMKLVAAENDIIALSSNGGMGDARLLAARVELSFDQLSRGALRKPDKNDWLIWEKINNAAVKVQGISDPTHYISHSNTVIQSVDTIQLTQKLKQSYSKCGSWSRLDFYFEQISRSEGFIADPATLKTLSATLSQQLHKSCNSLAVAVKIGRANVIIECIGKKETPELVETAAEVGRQYLPKGYSLVVPAKTSLHGVFTPRRVVIL